jgi:hypothetical protein
VSEYQYYEFLAVDRPLYAKAQSEVRALSTRARITATSFVNEYHWGDFRGSPDRLMEHHYDAHLYLANWGTRRVMFCLPASLLDLDAVEPFLVGDAVIAWTSGRRLVLALTSEDEPGDWDYEPQGSLSAIVGVRGELAAGDHRGLYLAWLAGFGAWERDEHAFDTDADEELEPPVPAGWARSPRRSANSPIFCVWTTSCSRSRPRPVRRSAQPLTIPRSLPPGRRSCRPPRRIGCFCVSPGMTPRRCGWRCCVGSGTGPR